MAIILIIELKIVVVDVVDVVVVVTVDGEEDGRCFPGGDDVLGHADVASVIGAAQLGDDEIAAVLDADAPGIDAQVQIQLQRLAVFLPANLRFRMTPRRFTLQHHRLAG